MIVPWNQLQPTTLRALVDEYVTRDGTDYGEREALVETKIQQVLRQLERGEIEVVFDPATQTCNLQDARAAKGAVARGHVDAPAPPPPGTFDRPAGNSAPSCRPAGRDPFNQDTRDATDFRGDLGPSDD